MSFTPLIIVSIIISTNCAVAFSSEDDIALAILRLVEIEKAVVEGAGATGLAACLSGKLKQLEGKKLVNNVHVYTCTLLTVTNGSI